jgi:DNA topoisomerase-2
MESKYKKQTHREHILSLPDTYIGSVETADEEVFLFDKESESFKLFKVPINPGMYKLVDELLVNAHDQVIRLKQKNSDNPVKTIDITCNSENFTIENSGEAIDVAIHPEYKIYIPQLIFGELLTSTNYDKEEKKLVGGKNGYGVKLVNIFAEKLDVHIVDSSRQVSYSQTFMKNMTIANPPIIKPSKLKSHVRISWTPDYKRFGLTKITDTLIQLIERRVWDLAMTLGKEIKVTWNGTLVKCRSLTDYAKTYNCDPVVFEAPNDRWQICLTDSPTDKAFNMSFVNGIWTSKGGKHVDTVTDQVVSFIGAHLKTKKKVEIKPSIIRDLLGVFIVSLIENPSFTSQTKETLTTKASAFGSSPKLSDETLKKVITKLNIVPKILEGQSERDAKLNAKTDGKKQSKIIGIPKLSDAEYAGTSRSGACTLILTEGDSAKGMAISGLTQEQRKTFGVFPLKGKILNVKDTSDSKVEHTKEIAELKKIMGLASGKKYKDVTSLRYGSIMIMTDQDYDGSHIRGLLINLFHELWHDLIRIPGFLTYMATPIVKAKKQKLEKVFYSQYEYEQWRKTPDCKGWDVKYYKGLGTSTPAEAKGYFSKVNAVRFDYTDDSDKTIDLAFNKKRADDRKSWLQTYDRTALVRAGGVVPYDEFINKDLIHFSYYNLERSIPNIMDGLKTSQRKILFAGFKRNLIREIKVAQFAGYISEHTGYHHGEASLNEAIIGMAQEFMGSNNIAWFVPQGQFGTRLLGGKDSASPRYIFTYLNPTVKKLIPADDLPIMKYRDDDGTPVEPEWYAPVLPMLLVNGSRGIGTGYSTYIPSYNPDDLKNALVKWISGDKVAIQNAKLSPWFRGFKGTIKNDVAVGVYKAVKDGFTITELPPGTWTQDYCEWLDKELLVGNIQDYSDTSTDTEVCITIKGIKEDALVKSLTENIRTTNMHAFDSNGIITKYETPNEILQEYAETRLKVYGTRKEYHLNEMKTRMPYHENLVRFIRSQCMDTPIPDLRRKSREECDSLLKAEKYGLWEGSYAYIMRLPISSFTKEEIAKHEAELKTLKDAIQKLEKSTLAELWLEDLTAL